MTFKDQSYREFGPTGLLVRVVDATGHAVTITRNREGRFISVTDAAGRPVQFFYNEDGRLHHLLDPSDGAGYLPNDVPDRTWVFSYGRSNRLEQVADAMGFATKFTYDAAGRITRLTDKDGDAYTYAYDAANRVVRVTDPQSRTSPEAPLSQQLAYTGLPNGATRTTYTDRRGNGWGYEFVNGAMASFANPLHAAQRFAYDGKRNLIEYRDALDHAWTAGYDERGNVLKVTDPLGHATEFEYNALNDLTVFTDAAGNVTRLQYEDVNHPTLLTSIIEPGEEGQSPAVTTAVYYGPADPVDDSQIPAGRWNGMLRKVYDPNNIWTGFAYDKWGQLAKYEEGLVNTSGTAAGCSFGHTSNSGGFGIGSISPGSGGTIDNDLNGNAISSSCILIASPPDPPAPRR